MDSGELELARSEALQKIGRNVVNFQRMESMLRFLARNSRVSAPLEKLTEMREVNARRLRKSPMGILADEVIRTVLAGQSKANAAESSDAPFSFFLDADQSYLEARRSALREVVASRNKLIHQWLAAFDPNSIESCRRLSQSLDEQREQFRHEYEILRLIVSAFVDSVSDIKRYLDTGEGEVEFEVVTNEA